MGSSPIPAEFIQPAPNAGSVKFAGVYLNLRSMSRALACDHGHLSRIFNSGRTPSVRMLSRLAAMLHMSMDEFMLALDARKNRTKVA